MTHKLKPGDAVKWKWTGDWAHGTVKKTFNEKVTVTIKGTDVTRNASRDEPAYLIEQEDGDQVLKSSTELHKE